MHHSTIDILPDEPMTTAQVMKAIKKDERTVQQLGKDQTIISHLEPAPRGGQRRMYDPASVAAFLSNPQKVKARFKEPPTALMRLSKPSQGADTASIVGQLLINQRQQNELIMSQFESVVSLILQSQKAEADANRERLKAEREDARERWEIERKDRLERNRRRLLPAAAAPKARKAHA